MIYLPGDIDSLLKNADLFSLISKHVDLKTVCNDLMRGHCPFHIDNDESLWVKKTSYRCYCCKASGDAITFLMDHCKMNFHEAVQSLCKDIGAEMETFKIPLQDDIAEKDKIKSMMYGANKLLSSFLKSTTSGSAVRENLRGVISDKTTEELGIGVCPGPVDSLYPCFIANGYSQEMIHKVFGTGPLIDCLTIPVRNGAGMTLGLFFVKYNTNDLKKWASPDTEVFDSSRHFFGMDVCRKRVAKEQRVILLSDPYAAAILIDKGLDMCLSTAGTELSEGHIRELTNLGVRKVILLRDDSSFTTDESFRSASRLIKGARMECRATRCIDCGIPAAIVRWGIRHVMEDLNNAELVFGPKSN